MGQIAGTVNRRRSLEPSRSRSADPYARGTDSLGFVSNFLDLTPLGRQEPWEEPKGRATALGAGAGDAAVRYHDEYDS